MPASKYAITVDPFGSVEVLLSHRAKRISIRLHSHKGIQLIVPHGNKIQDAIQFLQSHSEWVRVNRKKLDAATQKPTLFDEHTEFKTRSFALKIEKAVRKDVQLTFKNGQLLVTYPNHVPVHHQSVQEAIRFGIEEALRREAKSFLPGRIAWLAHAYGFHFSGVSIKNLKTRWGSCATTGNINLNLHLMRLPDHLIDYVLLHELAHTKEHNHGPNFWKTLDLACGGQAKAWDKEIKKYRTKIY